MNEEVVRITRTKEQRREKKSLYPQFQVFLRPQPVGNPPNLAGARDSLLARLTLGSPPKSSPSARPLGSMQCRSGLFRVQPTFDAEGPVGQSAEQMSRKHEHFTS